MLTDDEIKDAVRPLFSDGAAHQMVMKTSMDEYRAVEAAVIARLTAKPAAWKDVRGWSTTSPLIALMHIDNGDKLTPLYEIGDRS